VQSADGRASLNLCISSIRVIVAKLRLQAESQSEMPVARARRTPNFKLNHLQLNMMSVLEAINEFNFYQMSIKLFSSTRSSLASPRASGSESATPRVAFLSPKMTHSEVLRMDSNHQEV
jgi:hypothetical protein